MAAIDILLNALNERQIAQRVGLRHDEARMSYHLPSNTVANFDAFADIIAEPHKIYSWSILRYPIVPRIDYLASDIVAQLL